jgi:hypothetical protein
MQSASAFSLHVAAIGNRASGTIFLSTVELEAGPELGLVVGVATL